MPLRYQLFYAMNRLTRRARSKSRLSRLILLVVLMLAPSFYLMFRQLPSGKVKVEPASPSCTMIISGYSRPNSLAALAAHYAAMDIFQRVVVSWGSGRPVPSTLARLVKKLDLEDKVLVTVTADDLNLRFSPTNLPGSNLSCVFIADDDIYVNEMDVRRTYLTWAEHRSQIVGLFPRTHDLLYEGGPLKYVSNPRVDYSMVLTKFMVLHSSYLAAYFSQSMRGVRDLVRETSNCEDIAMNALVTNSTGLAPVYLRVPNKIDYGSTGGLYKRPHHEEQRHECMNRMCYAFGGCPFVKSSLTAEMFVGDKFLHGSRDPERQLEKPLSDIDSLREQLSLLGGA